MPASIKHLSQLAGGKQKLGITAILAKWAADQKFYEIEVLSCDNIERKCKVKFEDGYSCWMDAGEIHIQLPSENLKDELIVCCICDGGLSNTPNEIIMCDTCQQGYHINCHQPRLNRAEVKLDDEEATWSCVTCNQLLQMPESPSSQQKAPPVKTKAKQLKAEDVKTSSPTKSGIKKSRAMTPKNLNSTGAGAKVKKTPKIKLTSVPKKEAVPDTATLTDSLYSK